MIDSLMTTIAQRIKSLQQENEQLRELADRLCTDIDDGNDYIPALDRLIEYLRDGGEQ